MGLACSISFLLPFLSLMCVTDSVWLLLCVWLNLCVTVTLCVTDCVCVCVWINIAFAWWCVLYALLDGVSWMLCLNDWCCMICLLWFNTVFAGPKPGCENVEGAALILHLLDCVSCMLCLNDWCCCGLTLPLLVPSPDVKMWRELQLPSLYCLHYECR